MRNVFYAGIFSALTACAAPQTTFVDYPIVIDGTKTTYTKDSNGNCYLKVPAEDGREWRYFNERCDETGDSVALSFQERILLFHDRDDLTLNSRRFIDGLFLQAENYLNNKEKKRGYNDIPF